MYRLLGMSAKSLLLSREPALVVTLASSFMCILALLLAPRFCGGGHVPEDPDEVPVTGSRLTPTRGGAKPSLCLFDVFQRVPSEGADELLAGSLHPELLVDPFQAQSARPVVFTPLMDPVFRSGFHGSAIKRSAHRSYARRASQAVCVKSERHEVSTQGHRQRGVAQGRDRACQSRRECNQWRQNWLQGAEHAFDRGLLGGSGFLRGRVLQAKCFVPLPGFLCSVRSPLVRGEQSDRAMAHGGFHDGHDATRILLHVQVEGFA
jgi:hypothetical protein